MSEDAASILAHRLGNLCGVIRTQVEVVRGVDDVAALRRALEIIERASERAEVELEAARARLRGQGGTGAPGGVAT